MSRFGNFKFASLANPGAANNVMNVTTNRKIGKRLDRKNDRIVDVINFFKKISRVYFLQVAKDLMRMLDFNQEVCIMGTIIYLNIATQ